MDFTPTFFTVAISPKCPRYSSIKRGGALPAVQQPRTSIRPHDTAGTAQHLPWTLYNLSRVSYSRVSTTELTFGSTGVCCRPLSAPFASFPLTSRLQHAPARTLWPFKSRVPSIARCPQLTTTQTSQSLLWTGHPPPPTATWVCGSPSSSISNLHYPYQHHPSQHHP